MINSPVKAWRKQKELSELLGKEGKIVSYSMIVVPPMGFSNQAPYPLVLVELENGKRRTGQLVDYKNEDLKIGRKVLMVIRKIKETDREGVILYGIKFKPN